MNPNAKFTAQVFLALYLFSWAAQAGASATAIISLAYRHIDLAASRRNIKDYMAYDTPGFVAGAGGHLNRSQAATLVGRQMNYALWFKSKTTVRQIDVQAQTAKVKTLLHQEFLSAYLLPNGKRERFVLDYQNLDTWKRRSRYWERVSSITIALHPQRFER